MSFHTTSELALQVERELGHNLGSSSSSQRNDVVDHLDRAHKIIVGGGGILNYDVNGKRLRNEIVFSFARAQNPKIITLLPVITSANVTATRNSTTITFDSDPNNATAIQGYFIRINSEDELYRISSHAGAATTATLDGVYVGPANVTSSACEIYKLQYDVGSNDILQIISPIRTYTRGNGLDAISIFDKDELLEQYPMREIVSDYPSCASVVKETLGNVTIQFNTANTDYERLELDYIPIPSTLDTSSSDPIIPKQFRLVLVQLATYLMAVRNNDKRSAIFLQNARNMFDEMVQWNERMSSSGDPDYGRIVISTGSFNKASRIGFKRAYTIAS